MIVKHYKNKHYPNVISWLRILYASIFNKDIEIMFTEESKYTLDEVDQADRNKIYGRVSSKYKDGERQFEQWSTWNYSNGLFNVSIYYRIDGLMVFGKRHNVPINTWFKVPKPTFSSKIPVSIYFGGNDSDNNGIGGVAPKDLTYKLRIL
jgi:hypothetical protein